MSPVENPKFKVYVSDYDYPDLDISENPLFGLENCFITPHTAYVSEEALRECRFIAAENARSVLLGQTPMNIVRP